MNEHLRKSEAELNELLAEYWRLRHETGEITQYLFDQFMTLNFCRRCLHGNSGKQAEHASEF